MALTMEKRERIAEVIKDILLRRYENFPLDANGTRNAPFHNAILQAFEKKLAPYNISTPQLVVLASWLHGLNTSLGSGYENLAHILSDGYKRQFTGAFTLEITENQSREIEQIIANLKNNGTSSLADENQRLFSPKTMQGTRKSAMGFTADVFIETDTEITAVEIKSVRPNSGEGRGEKQKILYGKAALKLKYPDKNIRFFVGFPFDPTAETDIGYDKNRFVGHLIEFGKFFSSDEILLAGELWDALSGETNTMKHLLNIAEETARTFATRIAGAT